VVVREAAEAIARSLGLRVRWAGDHALLVDGEGSVHLYVFAREALPRLGVYGYYAAHFIELWEGGRLAEGLREVVEGDPYLSSAARALLALGERVVRVGRLVGKYGDPHVSRFFETQRLQVIRETLEVGSAVMAPRVAPGGYEWKPPREVCGGGVVGFLDGFWVSFSSRRIGFVRGLYVFEDCRLVAAEELYESMEDLEERVVGGLALKKIPYRLAASLLDASEAECCGYRVVEVYGPGSWETPLWKRVHDRFEVALRPLFFRASAQPVKRSGGDGGPS